MVFQVWKFLFSPEHSRTIASRATECNGSLYFSSLQSHAHATTFFSHLTHPLIEWLIFYSVLYTLPQCIHVFIVEYHVIVALLIVLLGHLLEYNLGRYRQRRLHSSGWVSFQSLCTVTLYLLSTGVRNALTSACDCTEMVLMYRPSRIWPLLRTDQHWLLPLPQLQLQWQKLPWSFHWDECCSRWEVSGAYDQSQGESSW